MIHVRRMGNNCETWVVICCVSLEACIWQRGLIGFATWRNAPHTGRHETVCDSPIAAVATADGKIGRSDRRTSSPFTSVFVDALIVKWMKGLGSFHCGCGYTLWHLHHVLMRNSKTVSKLKTDRNIWCCKILLAFKLGVCKMAYNNKMTSCYSTVCLSYLY